MVNKVYQIKMETWDKNGHYSVEAKKFTSNESKMGISENLRRIKYFKNLIFWKCVFVQVCFLSCFVMTHHILWHSQPICFKLQFSTKKKPTKLKLLEFIQVKKKLMCSFSTYIDFSTWLVHFFLNFFILSNFWNILSFSSNLRWKYRQKIFLHKICSLYRQIHI